MISRSLHRTSLHNIGDYIDRQWMIEAKMVTEVQVSALPSSAVSLENLSRCLGLYAGMTRSGLL